MTEAPSQRLPTLFAGLGRLGAAAARQRQASGLAVLGLNRSGRSREGVAAIAADLLRPLPAPLPAVDALVIALSPAARDADTYRRTYLAGVRHLLEALPQPPRRLIYVSSTVVYGENAGGWVAADTVADGTTERARVQLEAEQQCRALVPATCALRLGGIYGPGREFLLQRVRDGKPVQEQPPLYTNRIHERDAASLINHLLGLPEVPPVMLGVDHEPAPLFEVCSWLAARLGLPAPVGSGGTDSGKRISNAATCASGFGFAYRSYRDGYDTLIGAAAEDKLRGE